MLNQRAYHVDRRRDVISTYINIESTLSVCWVKIIAKCDRYTNCDRYYKSWEEGITKYDRYYKVWQLLQRVM